MFKTNDNKGFHITFPNGITLSTQFGGGNYCQNYNFPIGREREQGNIESEDAEIAIWNEKKWITDKMIVKLFPEKEYPDSVLGNVKIEEWLKIFDWCRNYREETDQKGD